MARALGEQLGRTLRTASGKADSRKKLMGAVHAAAKKQGIEPDDRHAIQLEVTGKASLTAMSLPEIGQVLDRLNRDRPAFGSDRPHLGKIRALWWSLYWLGSVDHPDESALEAFVKRQTGVERLRFLGHKDAPAVIEALKDWLAREGVRWPSADRLASLQRAWNPELTPATLDRHAVLDAIEGALQRRGALRGSWDQYLATTVPHARNCYFWTDRERDEGIRTLGKKLRRLLERERADS